MNTLKAYFAGLFDGEGCVIITKKKKTTGNYYYLQIHLSMTHRPTIELLHFCYPFQVYARKRQNWKTQFDWSANSANAYAFLTDIRPYSITKAAEIDAAIDFHNFSAPSYSNARGYDRSIIEAYGEHTKQLLSDLKVTEYAP